MAIIFQLFRAEDLAKLTPTELEDLQKEIAKAVGTSSSVVPVSNRAKTVFEQLSQNLSPNPLPLESKRTMLLKFFSAPALSGLDLGQLDAQQRDILEWAIYCAVTHEKLALEEIRKQVYDWYWSLPQMAGVNRAQIPVGSDADYQHILPGSR